MPNRLAGETSPYLLQHKDNPVDWYPWGDEAFARARAEDKPVFLSVGYSSCHWCHVMEHESFEDPQIAGVMNRHFVNIKVDREERPDVDAIYMAAVQAMTGHGGWPMSVFLTPDGKPFYAGTYFPPEDRGGLPAFPRLVEALAAAYRDRKGDIARATEEVVRAIEQHTAAHASHDPLTRDLLHEASRNLVLAFDREHGGLGRAPKFPQPMTYEFLLRYWHASREPHALEIVELTLDRMARGGMYDQVGGGFHRYSTDALWLVPHFEKMLYDNAQLGLLYLHAWQATGNDAYRAIVRDLLAYVQREMLHPRGGFYSAQDADSEGIEGKFFVWTPGEIDDALGPHLGPIARAYYGVTPEGNFEGKSILWRPRNDAAVATDLGISTEELRAAIDTARPKLLQARSQRIAPALDDKVLTSWNALMLAAFAEAGAAFEDDSYLEVARRNAAFLLSELVQDDRLLRTWKDGRAKLNAYLEDYACLVGALVTLYEATFEQRWLDEAVHLADGMIARFWDARQQLFFDTAHDHEQLIVRPRDIFDNATPCGGSAGALALLRLAELTANADYERLAVASLRSVRDFLARAPAGFANWLAALDFYASTVKEIVLVGPAADERALALRRAVWTRYLPNRVLAGAFAPPGEAASALLTGRELVDGRPTAYVCERYACRLPVTEPDALIAQLEG
jgi:hypothetical protein